MFARILACIVLCRQLKKYCLTQEFSHHMLLCMPGHPLPPLLAWLCHPTPPPFRASKGGVDGLVKKGSLQLFTSKNLDLCTNPVLVCAKISYSILNLTQSKFLLSSDDCYIIVADGLLILLSSGASQRESAMCIFAVGRCNALRRVRLSRTGRNKLEFLSGRQGSRRRSINAL